MDWYKRNFNLNNNTQIVAGGPDAFVTAMAAESNGNKCTYANDYYGKGAEGVSFKVIQDFLMVLGFLPIGMRRDAIGKDGSISDNANRGTATTDANDPSPNGKSGNLYMSSDFGAVHIFAHENQDWEVSVATTEVQVYLKVHAFFCEKLIKHDGSRSVYMLMQNGNSMSFSFLGEAGLELVRGNYPEEVLRGFDASVREIESKTPGGRITIMNGPPGTGKTFLVRALVQGAKANFIIISAEQVAAINSPGLVTALIQFRDEHSSSGPIVLIVEDGDSLVASRMADNVGGVSALLNLGDGIMGAMLDVRLVVTTNAQKDDFDAAIMRPGRLVAMMNVGPLGLSRAEEVYLRLGGKLSLHDKSGGWTLAEIYAQVRVENDGALPVVSQKKRSVGFGS